jgi:LPXTG-motif cell wall-anchored protein
MGYDFAYSEAYEQYIYAKGDNNMLFTNFTKDGTVATEENVYFFEVKINVRGDDSSIVANFTPLTSDVQDGAIYKGGRLTVTPPSQGGKWSFDEDFLSGNFTNADKPIFTGKKIGTTTISYTKLPDYEEIGEVEISSLDVSKDRAGREYVPVIEASDIAISADEADYTITMDVTIEAAELPQTGQDYTAPIALAGIGLAGAGSIVLIGRKKKA